MAGKSEAMINEGGHVVLSVQIAILTTPSADTLHTYAKIDS